MLVDCFVLIAINVLGSFKIIKNYFYTHITTWRIQKMNKNFDITNTIEVEDLAKRWGVTKKPLITGDIEGKDLVILRLEAKLFTI